MPGQVQGWAGWGQSCACAAGGFGKQHLLPALEGLLGQHCTLSPTGICCFALHLFPFVLETNTRVDSNFLVFQDLSRCTSHSVVKQDIVNLLLSLNCYSGLKVNSLCCCCTACCKNSTSVQELIGCALPFKKP